VKNPNPLQTEEFRNYPYKPQGEPLGKLSKRIIGICLPEDIDIFVRSLPNMSAWVRRVITEAAQRELMNPKEVNGPNP
jgi:hypothetical protein